MLEHRIPTQGRYWNEIKEKKRIKKKRKKKKLWESHKLIGRSLDATKTELLGNRGISGSGERGIKGK